MSQSPEAASDSAGLERERGSGWLERATRQPFFLVGRALYRLVPLPPERKARMRHRLLTTFNFLLPAAHRRPAITEAPAGATAPMPRSLTGPDPIGPDWPSISVIVPMYGKIDYTLRCLGSIAAHPPLHSFEVIVVDDGSADEAAQMLPSYSWLRSVRSPRNEGFVRACNLGATVARGRFLHFLNNDTEVEPGWLDELAETFERVPRAGLVGSMLINPDGKLQEAGSIVWQDGSAWNYGRHDDPSKPAYNHLRPVDYCSGASIMVPAALFRELGGFDELYRPAYYEDTDLAFRMRAIGLRSLYQPLSRIVHHEGVSSGTDLSRGIKAHQVANGRKFQQRWSAELARHGAPGSLPQLGMDRHYLGQVLVIDASRPATGRVAAPAAVGALMRAALDLGYKVTFIPEADAGGALADALILQRLGVEAILRMPMSRLGEYLRAQGKAFDAIVVTGADEARTALRELRRFSPGRPVLLLDLPEAAGEDAEPAADLDLLRAFDLTLLSSSRRARRLAETAPDLKLAFWAPVLPDAGLPPSYAERQTVLIGGGHEASQWFLREVRTTPSHQLDGVPLTLAEPNAPATSAQPINAKLASVKGIESFPRLLEEARVLVLPFRFGGDIKARIADAEASLAAAFEAGVPAVITSLAATGIPSRRGEELVIADDPQALVQEVAALYKDPQRWQAASIAALSRAAVSRAHRAEAAALRDIFAAAGIRGVTRRLDAVA